VCVKRRGGECEKRVRKRDRECVRERERERGSVHSVKKGRVRVCVYVSV